MDGRYRIPRGIKTQYPISRRIGAATSGRNPSTEPSIIAIYPTTIVRSPAPRMVKFCLLNGS
jgi:hypothetical protein